MKNIWHKLEFLNVERKYFLSFLLYFTFPITISMARYWAILFHKRNRFWWRSNQNFSNISWNKRFLLTKYLLKNMQIYKIGENKVHDSFVTFYPVGILVINCAYIRQSYLYCHPMFNTTDEEKHLVGINISNRSKLCA